MSVKFEDLDFWVLYADCFPQNTEIINDRNKEAITEEEWKFLVREWRDALLRQTDWTQIPDNSLTTEKREECRLYRQELRDITNVYPIARETIFPEAPSAK